jgi:ERCC4-type nuclease
MVLVDPRAGSWDLEVALRRIGVPATSQKPDGSPRLLPFGDCAFVGNGPDESPHLVGVELKTLGDVLQCITTGRFAGHQLPGMRASYDESWLVVEGQWRPGREGVLEELKTKTNFWVRAGMGRGWMYRDLASWLVRMAVDGGIHVYKTRDREETVRFVAALYGSWTKPYREHNSLKQFVDYKARKGNDPKSPADAAEFRKPSFVRRVAKEVKGVGWEKSVAVEEKFKTVYDMALAEEREWAEIEGIGPTIAARAVAEIRGRPVAGMPRAQAHLRMRRK